MLAISPKSYDEIFGAAWHVGGVEIRKRFAYLEMTASPVGLVVPEFIGQTAFDTVAKIFYTSIGLTNFDWIPGGGDPAEFDTRADALLYRISPHKNAVRTGGYSAVGDNGDALYYRTVAAPSHAAWFQSADGAFWTNAEPIIRPQMLGAKADGASADTVAVLNAAGVGRPVYMTPGTWLLGLVNISAVTAPVHIYGTKGTILQAASNATGIFYAKDKDDISIRNLKVVGKTFVGPFGLHGALTFENCNNVTVEDVEATNWNDRIIHYVGRSTDDAIAKNFRFSRVKSSAPQLPARFSGSCIYIGEHVEDGEVSDCDFRDANGGIFIQNVQALKTCHIRRIKVLRNYISGMAQYGIINYFNAPNWFVAGAVDNGAGLIRLTTTVAHQFVTGDKLLVASIVGTTEANATWLATVIDATTVDLQASVFVNAYVSGGTVTAINPVDIEMTGNTVEDTDGSPTATNGFSGNFGSAFYIVGGGGGQKIHHNVVRRSNLGTTGFSLAAAGIGANGITGDVDISNNKVEDGGANGIYAVSAPNGHIYIAGNTCRRNHLAGVKLFDVGSAEIIGNRVIARKGDVSSAGINVDATTAAQRLIVSGNNVNVYASTQPLAITRISDLIVANNNIINDGDATVVCELVKITTCAKMTMTGNNFDGGLSVFTALTLSNVSESTISDNNVKMTDSGAARSVVSMTGTCTGTVFERNNRIAFDRQENTSTGGIMHSRGTVNTSGGKTRQIGDTIENTVPVGGTAGYWFKVAASAGGADWKTLTIGLDLYTAIATDAGAAFSWVLGTHGKSVVLTAAITVDRAVALATTGAVAGDVVRFTRAAASTGAFNWNIGTGPLKALAAGQWCELTYSGAAWVLTQFGSL